MMHTYNLNYLPFGIDTIGLSVRHEFVNDSLWTEGAYLKVTEKINKGAIFYGEEKIKKIGNSDFLTLVKTKSPVIMDDLYLIRIQQEFLFYQQNYICQIVQIFMQLSYEGYLVFPPEYQGGSLFQWLLFNISSICSLNRLDFYMDFREGDFIQAPSTIKLNDELIHTTYSPDHRTHRSLWACYDRREKLKAKNQIKHKLINSMEYPIRLEIRFDSNNYGYNLHLGLLNGNFIQVANILAPVIARSWRKYKSYVATSYKQTLYNQFFNYIDFWSNQKKIPNSLESLTL